jgi:cytochrome P450
MALRDDVRPLEAYSLLDPAVQSDPYPFYAQLHAHAPVYKLNDSTGFYIVSNVDLCRQVLRDFETFSNDVDNTVGLGGPNADLYNQILGERGWRPYSTLQSSDPPRHARYRSLVDRLFTADIVRDLAPHIQKVTRDVMGAFIDKGECEFVSEFALPLPGIIIAEQIGLDRSQIRMFKRWADAIVGGLRMLDEAGVRATAETILEMQHYVARVVVARRAAPRNDMLSALVHAGADSGQALSMIELQSVMNQLIAGGYETTTTAIGTGVWLLIRFPEQAAKLRADRSLLRGFVEETLRFESPVQGQIRRVTHDVELAGVMIPEGAVVVVRYGAANRDETKFACPHQFDMERKNAGAHIAFGIGTHFCPGAALARLEMTTAFNAVLDRMGDLAFTRPLQDLPRGPNLLQFPIKELPIRFRKIA